MRPKEVGQRIAFTEFTAAEIADICGPWIGPRLAWPDPASSARRMTIHDVIPIMVQHELSTLRRRGPAQSLARSCVPTAVWFALTDCDGSLEITTHAEAGEPPSEDQRADLIEKIAGVPYEGVRRFLVCDWQSEMSQVREADLITSIDAAEIAPRTRSAFLVDLRAIGVHFAEHAQRPLVRVEG